MSELEPEVKSARDKTQANLEIAARRGRIDSLLRVVMAVQALRTKLTDEIGEIKAEHGIPVHDGSREDDIYATIRVVAEEYGLHPDVMVDSFEPLIVHSRARQQVIAERAADIPANVEDPNAS